MERLFYSLREAAGETGIPEPELRRAILTDELEAEPISDDRQYLISTDALESFLRRRPGAAAQPEPAAPRPTEKVFCLTAFALICFLSVGPLLLCLWLGSIRDTDSYCVRCARTLHTKQFGKSLVLSASVSETDFSRVIRSAETRPCRHEWIPSHRGHASWKRLGQWKKWGVIEAAQRVDPEGAVEFIRWNLRRPRAASRMSAPPRPFASAAEFRAWFNALQAR